jgi:hypothetical protein
MIDLPYGTETEEASLLSALGSLDGHSRLLGFSKFYEQIFDGQPNPMGVVRIKLSNYTKHEANKNGILVPQKIYSTPEDIASLLQRLKPLSKVTSQDEAAKLIRKQPPV